MLLSEAKVISYPLYTSIRGSMICLACFSLVFRDEYIDHVHIDSISLYDYKIGVKRLSYHHMMI